MAKDMERAVIAANRFGLGARPDELRHIADDPKGWVLAQLDAPPLARGDYGKLPDSLSYQQQFVAWNQAYRQAREAVAGTDASPAVAPFDRFFKPQWQGEVLLRARQQCVCDNPVSERLALFWSNHFTVSAEQALLRLLAGSMEREVIRPAVYGRFDEMLLAVEQHPAMLLYLNNNVSVGPDSKVGIRVNQRNALADKDRVGINENLGREIMELHVLDPDSGYTQADVIQMAKGITGWRPWISGRQAPPLGEHGSTFVAAVHEPGTRTLLGREFPDTGADQGRAMLRYIAASAAASRFIANKLTRHFVSDDPPPALVHRVAASYRKHDGELLPVYRTLFESEEAWHPRPAKFRRPDEYLIAACRALGEVPDTDKMVWYSEMVLLGQVPFRPGAPAGWGDSASDWIGADEIWKRFLISRRHGNRLEPGRDPMELARDSLGPWLGDATAVAISAAYTPHQGAALALASPEFQWR